MPKLHSVCPEVLGMGVGKSLLLALPLFSLLFHRYADAVAQSEIHAIRPCPRSTGKTFVNGQLLRANCCDLQVDGCQSLYLTSSRT